MIFISIFPRQICRFLMIQFVLIIKPIINHISYKLYKKGNQIFQMQKKKLVFYTAHKKTLTFNPLHHYNAISIISYYCLFTFTISYTLTPRTNDKIYFSSSYYVLFLGYKKFVFSSFGV